MAVCEGVGETMRVMPGETEVKTVFFCTAITDPKQREYEIEKGKVQCNLYLFCQARRSGQHALEVSGSEINFNARLAHTKVLPDVRGVRTAGGGSGRKG
jgi:hypothetical protein